MNFVNNAQKSHELLFLQNSSRKIRLLKTTYVHELGAKTTDRWSTEKLSGFSTSIPWRPKSKPSALHYDRRQNMDISPCNWQYGTINADHTVIGSIFWEKRGHFSPTICLKEIQQMLLVTVWAVTQNKWRGGMLTWDTEMSCCTLFALHRTFK